MNINVDEVLQAIQDFRSQLEGWGLTNEGLWFLAAVAAILFFLSMREVASWYFKVNQVRDEVRELRRQITDLQKTVKDGLIASGTVQEPMKPEELLKIAEGMREASHSDSLSAKFRFDH